MLTYVYQYGGISIYFAESIEKISDNLKEVHPHVMSVVPRLLEKVYDKIYAKGADLTGIKKKLFFWALDLGMEFKPYNENGAFYNFKLGIARKLIFSKWQEGLGGELELVSFWKCCFTNPFNKSIYCGRNSGYGRLRINRNFSSNFC